MARYTAEESKAMEYQGADTFRIEKDGGRAQVVFLYTDESSIDGWSCHRLPGANFYTYTVDCPRGPKDPIEKCPACQAGEPLSTRVFVRMLDLASGKVMIWDKPASFRKELAGFMHYFNPLYKQKYEITRTGTSLNTKYNFQSIGDSGIPEEQYKELVNQANDVCDAYVRPIDKYEEIKARSEAAKNEQVQVEGQQGQAPQQNAWGQNQAPQQNAWSQNQAPQQGWGGQPQNGWGAPQNQAPQQGWGAPQGQPQNQATQNQATQNQQPQQGGWAPQNQQPQNGWGSTPQGAWNNNPQN